MSWPLKPKVQIIIKWENKSMDAGYGGRDIEVKYVGG